MIYSLNEFQITTPLGRYSLCVCGFLFLYSCSVSLLFVLISLLWECIKFVNGFAWQQQSAHRDIDRPAIADNFQGKEK